MTAPTRKDVLTNMTFGQRIAEEEEKELAKYFVKTEQWRQISSGHVDIVYGPKGSGKSALYALLQDTKDHLFSQGIITVSGENPRGATVFKDLANDPPTGETEFVNLWKLYFLSLAGGLLKDYAVASSSAKQVLHELEEAKLLPSASGLSGLLKAASRYLRRPIEALQGELKFDTPTMSPSIKGRIVFHEPEADELQHGAVSVDHLFRLANEALAFAQVKVWILLDRLDVAFAESPELEANALRALFKVYLDLLSGDNLKLKIFLRSDIWSRVMKNRGFREASHITKHTTIKWDKQSLVNLIIRRAIQSPAVLLYAGLTADEALAGRQEEFLNKLFPLQVESGANRSKTIDWILNRTTDGSGLPAPRELIHFLNTTRQGEMRDIELGTTVVEDETLFSRQAIKSALPEVSKVRLEQTLYAEYPDLRKYITAMEREKSTQHSASLAKIWHVDEAAASSIAEQLVEIGFFEKTGEKDAPIFRVPFLYRPALDLVQGAAELD